MSQNITAHQPPPEAGLSSCNPNSQHQSWSRWVFEVRVEGKPALDPRFQDLVRAEVARFMRASFGTTAQMKMTVFWEAGDLHDGKPPAQLLMMPTHLEAPALWGKDR